MTRRVQIGLLVGLLVVLAGVVYSNSGGGPQLSGGLFADQKFEPLNVPDPTLRFDLLEKIAKLEYPGPKRNPFVATLPPPPIQVPTVPDKGPDTPVVPQKVEPPAVNFPFKFYGFTSDTGSGKRRAFFTDGDDVWIVGEGETIQRRFRLLRIGNTSAEVEEIASSRRINAPLEQPPSP